MTSKNDICYLHNFLFLKGSISLRKDSKRNKQSYILKPNMADINDLRKDVE